MLFKETVHEDWQGSETNVVQSQIYAVIQSLKGEEEGRSDFFFLTKKLQVIMFTQEQYTSQILSVTNKSVTTVIQYK